MIGLHALDIAVFGRISPFDTFYRAMGIKIGKKYRRLLLWPGESLENS